MNTAIILAGGRGTRMKSPVPKQFMELNGRPLLCYSLKAFQDSEIIDQMIVVTSKEYFAYVQSEIVEKYHIDKVWRIAEGGQERYDSVYAGLCAIDSEGYVFIHDGARPCITPEIIEDCYKSAIQYSTAVAAVPVKDTIKVADEDGMACHTPDRRTLWQIQTPQVFDIGLVKQAYEKLFADSDRSGITDDAMVVEQYGQTKVKLVRADYRNIKVTTPEDIAVAGLFLRQG